MTDLGNGTFTVLRIGQPEENARLVSPNPFTVCNPSKCQLKCHKCQLVATTDPCSHTLGTINNLYKIN